MNNKSGLQLQKSQSPKTELQGFNQLPMTYPDTPP